MLSRKMFVYGKIHILLLVVSYSPSVGRMALYGFLVADAVSAVTWSSEGGGQCCFWELHKEWGEGCWKARGHQSILCVFLCISV